MLKRLFIFPTLLLLPGCATTSEAGEKVVVVTKVDDSCKNLGPVTVFITAWGLPSESMAVLRNNTAKNGGNTLVPTGESTGIAYFCSEGSFRN